MAQPVVVTQQGIGRGYTARSIVNKVLFTAPQQSSVCHGALTFIPFLALNQHLIVYNTTPTPVWHRSLMSLPLVDHYHVPASAGSG